MLDKIQINSPCASNWDEMVGNDTVRFCRHCDLSVYNLSSMTRRQAEDLIARANGRLCVKYFRNVNGSVVTTDSASQSSRLTARFIAGTFSVLLSFNSSVMAQSPLPNTGARQAELTVTKNTSAGTQPSASLSGRILDPNNAVIEAAKITLINESNNIKLSSVSNHAGEFRFTSLSVGEYSLIVDASGFSQFAIQHLKLKEDEEMHLEANMHVGSPICEIVEVRGGSVGDGGTIGTLAMVHRKGFWGWVIEIITYPYKGSKKIFSR
jgi:hypothetical protein